MNKLFRLWQSIRAGPGAWMVVVLGLAGAPAEQTGLPPPVYLPLIVVQAADIAPPQEGVAVPSASNGIWVSRQELMALPMSGAAWNRLKERADRSLGAGNIGDQDSDHDILTLATALVAARTSNPAYRTKTVDALISVIGTDELPDSHCGYTPSKARSLAIARNFTAYIIAADLIDLRAGTDGGKGSQWSSYVNMLRFKPNCPNTSSGSYPAGNWHTISQTHDQGGSNANTQAGAARVAAALYLNDRTELEKAWEAYQRYAGDSTKCPSCKMRASEDGRTWSHDPGNPVPVNPAGATINGHSVDGALINDISRGGVFTWPPQHTGYPWVGMEGFIAQAHMLARAGYPAWEVQKQAPRRAVAYLKYLSEQFGPDWWERTDWVKYVVNKAYGATFPAGYANGGHIMAWTDWTHGTSGAPPGDTPPPANAAPTVNAGADQSVSLPNGATLDGSIVDDGLPNPPGALAVAWSKVSGPGEVSFGNPNTADTTASFASAGAYVLRLTAGDGELSASDEIAVNANLSPSPSTLSFTPAGDTFVNSARPTRRHGSDSSLQVRSSTAVLRSYLKFQVTGTGGVVQSARLRLYVKEASNQGGAIYVVANEYTGASTPWTEQELTWNNAPAISGNPLSTMGAVKRNTWVEYDVSAVVTGDGIYSFSVQSSSADDVAYSAKESKNKPVLVLATGNATPASNQMTGDEGAVAEPEDQAEEGQESTNSLFLPIVLNP